MTDERGRNQKDLRWYLAQYDKSQIVLAILTLLVLAIGALTAMTMIIVRP